MSELNSGIRFSGERGVFYLLHVEKTAVNQIMLHLEQLCIFYHTFAKGNMLENDPYVYFHFHIRLKMSRY